MSVTDDEVALEQPPTTVVEDNPKKKVRKSKKTVVETQPGEDPIPQPITWFGRKQKMNGRMQVRTNETGEEVDVLSLALYSGISSDADLAIFMLDEYILKSLEDAAKSVTLHTRKTGTTTVETALITRYYNEETHVPEVTDPRVTYKPSLDKYSRWVIRSSLVPTMCVLLDDNQVGRVRPGDSTPLACMVTFKGIRRDLRTIQRTEIEDLEKEMLTSQSINSMRELLYVRRILLKNSEEGMEKQVRKNDELETIIRTLEITRDKQFDDLKANFDRAKGISESEHQTAIVNLKRESVKVKNCGFLEREESQVRLTIQDAYTDVIINMTWRLAILLSRQRRPEKAVMVVPEEKVPDDVASLRIELEDAKLEIARLKDDMRGKAIPKPKAHRKVKDPDIHLATEAEMKTSVRAHLSMQGSSSNRGGTPMSGISSVITRATRRVGTTVPGGYSTIELRKMEEQELEAASRLKALSRSREQDLCNAESASEQLIEVVEALSSNLTRVSLTIEDVSIRRTAILNHMRSLAMNSRGITTIIRERPYLLSMARRMNHERRPVVQLNPLRALINVSAANLKALQQIETITLESISGVFNVMSLEEAAEAATIAQQEDESWLGPAEPDQPAMTPRPEPQLFVHSPSRGPLTRTTLFHHTRQMASGAPPLQGRLESIGSSP